MLSDVENITNWVGHSMVLTDIQVTLAIVSTVLIPVGIWFATFTLGRLRSLEVIVVVLQTKQSEAITRVEFNDRIDKLQDLLMENIMHGVSRTRLSTPR